MPHCLSMLRSLFLLSVCVTLLSRGAAAVAVVTADETEAAADQATLTLEVYDTEHNYRQSFCDQYALLHNDTLYLSMLANTASTAPSDAETDAAAAGDAIKTTIANVLSGANLNFIVADDNVHFNYEEGIGINTTVPGFHAEILDYMAEQSNFTWRESFGIMYPKDIQFPNTWTTYLDWSTERYDMVIDYFAPSLTRMQMGVTFTESYINGDMLLIKNQYTQPEAKIHWWNWLLPFTNEVWYATLATILISAMIFPFFEYMGSGLDNLLTIREKKKRKTNRLYKGFLNATGNYAYDPQTPGGCIFGVVFAFWSMLMVASYTANLASLLVVKRIVPPPSINGIQNAIDHSKSMCYPYGTFAGDYLEEMYPREITNPEIFIPVPDLNAEKYGALNNGTCDFLIDFRNTYDIAKHQKEYNPECRLVQEGRNIKSIGLAFATMLDPGHMCTLLVKEVFNYYIQQMNENGKLTELWQAHISRQSDPGHCDSTYGDNTERLPTEGEDSEDGTEDDDAAATRQRRYLKAGQSAATAGSVMTELEEESAEGEELALTIEDLAGTFLLQVMGVLAAILVTVLSSLVNKYILHKKVVRVKLLEQQHQQHPPTTHSEDDTVDDTKNGSRPRNNSNRETTISTKGSNTDYNGTDDVHDDNDHDECSRQEWSTRVQLPPSFKSNKNNNNGDKDPEREPEYSSQQLREHPSLDRVQKRLNHLEHQNDTIISLLENMRVVSQKNSLD